MIKTLKHKIASAVFWLFGWKFEGKMSGHRKEIIVVAPHTSNWDFVVMIAASWYFKTKISWIGKQELFEAFWPLKKIYELTGGIPVNRKANNNLVESLGAYIRAQDKIHVCIPPEGTRSKNSGWRTGFYYMAMAANVPITLSYLDFERKVAGMGPSFTPTGDVEKDLEFIRNFYKPIKGKYPDKQSPIIMAPRKLNNAHG